MSKCCKKPNVQLIQSGGSRGVSINTRQSVTVCLKCGQFKVFSEVNFQSQTINFHIWRDDQITAALIPVNDVQKSEGNPLFSLIQHAPAKTQHSDKFGEGYTMADCAAELISGYCDLPDSYFSEDQINAMTMRERLMIAASLIYAEIERLDSFKQPLESAVTVDFNSSAS